MVPDPSGITRYLYTMKITKEGANVYFVSTSRLIGNIQKVVGQGPWRFFVTREEIIELTPNELRTIADKVDELNA